MRAREFVAEDQTASAQEVLDYLLKIHPPEETTPFLKDLVLKWPRYELRTVPLSQLKIPPPYYPDDAEEEDERVDPYGRTLWIDYDYAGEVSQRNVDQYPIIVDPQGHIIDGNHRAWAAAELLNRDSIKAWVAVPEVDENFADGKNPGRKGLSKRVGVNCKQSVTKLRKIAKNSSGERQRMAHWCANMKAGRKKSK
jgi:hypothetical protein